MGPRIPLRPPILGSVIRIPRTEFRIESPSVIKTATSRSPMGYGRGAQSDHKERGVNFIRVNISLLVVIIPDMVEIAADHGRYKRILVVEADRRRTGKPGTCDFAFAMGQFPGKFP